MSSPDPPPSPGPVATIGRLVVLVHDPAAALAFYRDVLGFRVLYDETDGGFRYLHVGPGGPEATGLWLMTPASEAERSLVGRQAGSQPLLVLYTDDLAALRARLEQAGVRTWGESRDTHSSSLHTEDLYGNVLVVAQLA